MCVQAHDIFSVPLKKRNDSLWPSTCNSEPATATAWQRCQTNGAKALCDIFICNKPVRFLCPAQGQNWAVQNTGLWSKTEKNSIGLRNSTVTRTSGVGGEGGGGEGKEGDTKTVSWRCKTGIRIYQLWMRYIWKVEAEYEQWRGGEHSLTPPYPATLNPLTTPNPPRTPFPLRASFGSSTKAFVQSTVLFLFTLHLSSELSIRHGGDGWSKTEPHTHDRRIEP